MVSARVHCVVTMGILVAAIIVIMVVNPLELILFHYQIHFSSPAKQRFIEEVLAALQIGLAGFLILEFSKKFPAQCASQGCTGVSYPVNIFKAAYKCDRCGREFKVKFRGDYPNEE
jgi:hypothetical protein